MTAAVPQLGALCCPVERPIAAASIIVPGPDRSRRPAESHGQGQGNGFAWAGQSYCKTETVVDRME